MGAKHDELAKLARDVKMSAEDRHEQRIDLAHGNLPEEMISSSKELMRKTDEIMRSKGGWDGESTSIFTSRDHQPATA